MIATPAAAAVPARNDVGSDQNKGAQVSTPAAARDKATTETTVLWEKLAATTKPTAPTRAGIITCQRRSRFTSALRPHRFIATTAHKNGMALNQPILVFSLTPVPWISVGIQKVRPY